MAARTAVFLAFICLVASEIQKKGHAHEKRRMVGVDTVHDVIIDKDVVISRNEVLPKKNPGKLAHDKNIESKNDNTQNSEPEPDWSYSSFPNDIKEHVDNFKKNMTECLKEVQANDKRAVKRLSPKTESPVYGECLIACVLKRNGVIHNGKINKENLLTLVGKFYAKDTKLMKKLEHGVDRCIALVARAGDDCARAAQLNACTNGIMENNKHKLVVNYQ